MGAMLAASAGSRRRADALTRGTGRWLEAGDGVTDHCCDW